MENRHARKSEVAFKAAKDALGDCHPHTFALLMLYGVSDRLRQYLGSEKAAEYFYRVADSLAAEDRNR